MEIGVTINCNIIEGVVSAFFQRTLDDRVVDRILSHLLICPSCAKKYEQYAKSHNYPFDLKIESANFVAKLIKKNSTGQYNKTMGVLSEKYPQVIIMRHYRYLNKVYGAMYVATEVAALRGLYNEIWHNKHLKELDEFIKESYANYIAENICEKVDILNKIYAMSPSEGGVTTNG